MGQDPEPPPYPPPGRLIDVGGWRLHLNCTGERRPGQPTVILEAGKGDFSVEWSLVQPGVARYARVCSYDRGGDGWSDLGPHPRTMRQVAYELHALLHRAEERPPFMLVGHSYGGWLVRVYQATYPSDVAAIVLVDAGANDPWRILPDGRLGRSSALVTERPVPAVKTATPLRVADIPPAALSQMKAGLSAASATANQPPRDKLPAEARQMRTWALGQLGHVAAAVNPFENEELAALRADRAKSDHVLGDLPLVVITRGQPDEEGPDAEALERDHRSDQASMVAMSRRGRHVIAIHSGHHVHIDEPDLVVRTIHEILTAVQAQKEARDYLDQRQAQTPPLPSITLPAELDRVLRDYEREWLGRSPAGLAGLFTEDGFVLQPGHPPVRGRAAIARAYQGHGGPLALRALAYATADTVGYIVGAYAGTPDAADDGKFILLLRRTANGKWQIAADMDNGNRPR